MSYLVVLGAFVLVFALIPCAKIIRSLQRGRTRRLWWVLTGLIVLFIGGYGMYFFGLVHGDHLVPVVFFLGSIFVLGIVSLSFQTLRVVRRVSTLEEENITDPLMGIFNRRYFDRRIEQEFTRSKRSGDPLSLLIFDLDCFKQINDNWGHQAGDDVLRRIGEVLLSSTRDQDIAARLGGDEIAIILPSDDLSGAERVSRRILDAVSTTEFVSGIRCSVSMGVAQLLESDRDAAVLVERSDRALYAAKQSGKNCVVTAKTLE